MHELYKLISDPGTGEILTLITIGLICLGYLSFIWGNSKKLNIRLTSLDWAQIYTFGLIVFVTGVILLGKLIVPTNADDLLQMLHIYEPLRYLTTRYQTFLLSLLRMLM
jgi:hypothetical protein